VVLGSRKGNGLHEEQGKEAKGQRVQ